MCLASLPTGIAPLFFRTSIPAVQGEGVSDPAPLAASATAEPAVKPRGLSEYARDGWAMGGAAVALATKPSGLRRFVLGACLVIVALYGLTAAGVVAIRNEGSFVHRLLLVPPLLYVAAFLSNLAGVGIAAMADDLLAGREAVPRRGLDTMVRRIPQVAGWALVVLGVGLLSRVGTGYVLDQAAAVLLGFGWGVLSFFAIPAIALAGDGPIRAASRSLRLVAGRWGVQVTGMVYVWLRPAIFVGLPGLIAVGAGILLVQNDRELLGWSIGASGVVTVAMAYLLVVTANSIFSVALFRHAEGKPVPPGFDEDAMDRVMRAPTPIVKRFFGRYDGERAERIRARLQAIGSDGG